MSVLFTVENKIVKPNPETLLTPPFREIWERDTNPQKHTAIAEFTYIEFMTSARKTNPYVGYAEHIRRQKINIDIMGHEQYEPDALVLAGMKWLTNWQKESSTSYNYWMAARRAAEKMQEFFNNFDIDAVNIKTGNPLYKPKDITSALNDTATVLRNLNELAEKVENELFEAIKTKGQKVISPFADPNQ